MKQLLPLILFVFLLSACKQAPDETVVLNTGEHQVVALEQLGASTYSYVRVQEDGKEYWIAAPLSRIVIGDTYRFSDAMEMKDFESKELNRIFPEIYFVAELRSADNSNVSFAEPEMQAVDMNAIKPDVNAGEIAEEQMAGSMTIAEVFRQKDQLKGKPVRVTGKVTKYNPAIMNVNWVHIQDGSEHEGEFDLTITTLDEVQMGEVVTLEGVLTLDKDFGAGYFYKVIVEQAKVIKP